MADDKLSEAVAQLSAQDRQDLSTALYHIRSGNLDQSKFNMDKVNSVWGAVQANIAQPRGEPTGNPGQYNLGQPRGAISAVGESIGLNPPTQLEAAEAGIPALGVAHQIYSTVANARENYRAGGVAGVLGPLVGANPQLTAERAARGDVGGVAGSLALPTAMAALGLVHGMARAEVAPEAAGHPVTEVVAPRPPVSETGKVPLPENLRPGTALLKTRASAIATDQATPFQRGGTVGLPEISFTRELRAQAEAAKVAANPNPPSQLTKAARIQEKAAPPNEAWEIEQNKLLVQRSKEILASPQATPEEKASAANMAEVAQERLQPQPAIKITKQPEQVVQAQPLLEKPVPPKGRAVKGDPDWQAYAAKRDAWLKQQKDIRVATEGKPVQPSDPLSQIDTGVKRAMKAPTASELEGRQQELVQTIRNAYNLPAEEGQKLADVLRQRQARFSAQADEVARVAKAPEQIEQMEGERGRPLLGEWERTTPGEGEAAGGPGEGRPIWKTTNLNEVPPAERDLYHEMLGHGTAQVLTRDAGGNPVEIRFHGDEEKAQYGQFIDRLTAEKQKLLKSWEDRGYPPTPEEVDQAAELNDQIEQYSGIRNRLAVSAPRKGLPVVDAQGVVRAPGIIPDIGQRTANALLGRPEGAHFAKPDAARLAEREGQLRHASQLYDIAASALEKKHGLATKPTEPAVAGLTPEQAKPVKVEQAARLFNKAPEELTQVERFKAEQATKQQPAVRVEKPMELRKEVQKASRDLFGKRWESLEAPERERVEAQLAANKLIKGAPRQPQDAFAKNFPAGDLDPKLQTTVQSLHQLVDGHVADIIRKAVEDQGLATREANYKLYGRALGAWVKSGGDPAAMETALKIASRDSEKGALRASFLIDLAKAAHDRLTPGRMPETPGEAGKSIMREEGAKRFQYNVRVRNQLDGAIKRGSRLTYDQGVQFQKDIESGAWRQYPQNSQQFRDAALLRMMLDEGRNNLQAIGKLNTFYQNYFPHRFEGIHDMGELMARMAKSPLRGRGTFLKQRTFQTLDDALTTIPGLRVAESNPAQAVMNVLAEQSHYIMGQNILNDLRARNFEGGFSNPRRVPAGWEHLDQKVAGPNRYAPAELARVFNNYFDPGIFAKSRTLDTIRIYNNAAQIAAVSLSGFHMGLTAMEGFTTDLSLGLKYALSGDLIKSGRAFGRAAVSPLDTMMRGSGWLKEYKNAGAMGAQISDEIRAYMQGGGRPGISEEFDVRRIYKETQRNFLEALSKGDIHAAANSALMIVPRTLRMLSVPVQDFWVPRMKMGATMKMIQYEMERLGPGASEAERRAAFKEVIDSADNRFGQMVRDNLFWNKSLADVAQIGFKFVDFNYGSLREMYGAGKDIPRALVAGGMSHRLAHALAFPAGIAMGGAILNYMLTGEGPKNAEDYFFPRNGRVGPDGKPERVMLPSYLRTAYELGKPATDLAGGHPRESIQDAAQAAAGRLSPIVTLTKEMITNRDFLGNQVVNKDDPFIQQMGQIIGAVVRQAQPISKGAAERAEQLGGTARDKALAVAGVQPVPKSLGVDQTAAERELSLQLRESYGGGYSAPEHIAHERAMNRLIASARNGQGDFGKIYKEEVQAGHIRSGPDKQGKTDLDKIVDRMQGNYLDRVKELNLPRQVDVLEKAQTQKERQQILGAMTNKLDSLWDMPEGDRAKLWQRITSAQRKSLPAQ